MFINYSNYKPEENPTSPTDTYSSSGSVSELCNLTEQSSSPNTSETGPVKVIKAPKRRKQYQCTYCIKFFSRPSALTTHTYTHTSEKPYPCTESGCGRNFSVVSNLRRHLKVHQKPSVGNKLSPEDRLCRVRQLIKNSKEFLSGQKAKDEQISLDGRSFFENQQNKYSPVVPESHRYEHFLLLPKINDNNYDSNFNMTNSNYTSTTSSIANCWDSNVGQNTGIFNNNFSNYNPSDISSFSPNNYNSTTFYYNNTHYYYN